MNEAPHADQFLPGNSVAVKALRHSIGIAADSDCTVLLSGETGSGKELVAKAIHMGSDRRGGPFVAVNCGSIPHDLIESELFGHMKGSFTGASENRVGYFETAEKGTIFLDEVNSMPPKLQAALLRVLQEREIRRVGDSRMRSIDVRVICAANANLKAAVANGTFREDLYYRMCVLSIRVPPLRERKEDIPQLVARKIRTLVGERVVFMSEPAMSLLMRHKWPGNVRELFNVVERALAMTSRRVMYVPPENIDFGEHDDFIEFVPVEKRRVVKLPVRGIPLEEIERQAVQEALDMCNFVQKDAAELLSVSPRVLNYKIKSLGLEGYYMRGRNPGRLSLVHSIDTPANEHHSQDEEAVAAFA
jgi:transcriptional regulator with PAS, ATPase and Fis domain